MTHRAGGELSQIKASKNNFISFSFFFPLLNTSLDLDLLVLAHPQHRSFCLIACEASKSLLGHVPYSPAGVARALLALTGSPVLAPGATPGTHRLWPWSRLVAGTWPVSLRSPQLLAPGHTGPLVPAQLLTSGPPTHMNTSWGVPPPEEELEMEFNEKTEETVVTGHWASADKCTDQPPA